MVFTLLREGRRRKYAGERYVRGIGRLGEARRIVGPVGEDSRPDGGGPARGSAARTRDRGRHSGSGPVPVPTTAEGKIRTGRGVPAGLVRGVWCEGKQGDPRDGSYG